MAFYDMGIPLVGSVSGWLIVLDFGERVDVVDTIVFSPCFPPLWPCQVGKKGGTTASSHSFTTVFWSILLLHIILTLFFFVCREDTKEGRRDETRRDLSHIKPIWGGEDDKPGKGTGAGVAVLYLTCWSLRGGGSVFVYF